MPFQQKRTNRTRVLILEPHANGHHGPYLSWMALGLAKHGFDVSVITLLETAGMPALEPIAWGGAGGRNGVPVSLISGPLNVTLPSGRTDGTVGLLAREFAYWRLFWSWYKTHAEGVQPDVVFLPYLDYCLYAIGLLGSPFGRSPWAGLAMRPSFHYRAMGIRAPKPALAGIKETLFFRMIRNRYLRRLLTIDGPLMKYLDENMQLRDKVTLLPESTNLGELPPRTEAKRMLGFAATRRVILVYGAITERKGVPELLRALLDPEFPVSVDVLLAGNISKEIRVALSSPAARWLAAKDRVRLMDRFIGIEEESILFAAADIVWLGYRKHYGASGVLTQAASAGRPVVATDEGVIGWQTKLRGLGQTVNPTDSAAVVAAVGSLIERTREDSISELRGRVTRGDTFDSAQEILARALVGDMTVAKDEV